MILYGKNTSVRTKYGNQKYACTTDWNDHVGMIETNRHVTLKRRVCLFPSGGRMYGSGVQGEQFEHNKIGGCSDHCTVRSPLLQLMYHLEMGLNKYE
jgi:hypothetical protein